MTTLDIRPRPVPLPWADAQHLAALACGCTLTADETGRVRLHSCGKAGHDDAPTNWLVKRTGSVTTLVREREVR